MDVPTRARSGRCGRAPHPGGPQPPRQRAYTLLESLVTLAIATVLLTLVLPGMRSLLARNRMVAQVNGFVTALQVARSEAVKRGDHVVLCPSDDGNLCAVRPDWSRGWIVFSDQDHDRERTPEEQLILVGRREDPEPVMTVSQHRRRIVYYAPGDSGGSNAAFTFCDPTHIAAPRVICLSNTGRPRVATAACSGDPIECP